MNFAAEIAGLSDVFDDIERKHFEKQDALNEYNMRPENQPSPYHPGSNPVVPDYPSGRPTGTGTFALSPGGEELQAFNPLGLLKMRILKEAIDGQPLNPGTIMSPKMEQEIYEPGQMVTPTITSPRDREMMELYKTGFV